LTASPHERRQEWKERRAKTYRGSLHDFLRSLLAGTLEQDGFHLYQGKLPNLRSGSRTPVTPDRFRVDPVPGERLWSLRFQDWLYVRYTGGDAKLASYIRLNQDAAVMDEEGGLVDPLCLDIFGDWVRSRVADMLPLNDRE